MGRRVLRNVVLGASLLVVTGIALEIGVRLTGYSDRFVCEPVYMPFDGTDEIPYVHRPNLTNAKACGKAIINTDGVGLRARTAGTRYGPKHEKEFRIAIVGDSVTFGSGVPRTEDTFPQVLEDTLNHEQRAKLVRVFNYGASGYSVKQMVATLRDRTLDVQPDLVAMAIIPDDLDLARTPAIDSTGYFMYQDLSWWLPPESMLRRLMRPMHLSYPLRDIGYRLFKRRHVVRESLLRGEVPESYSYLQKFKDTAGQYKLPT